jgi:hypothetical protein
VLSPDKKYFYLYFPDWMANGTLHTTNANGSQPLLMSQARAPVASALDAAFGSARPHAVEFEKFYQGTWHLQPGIGGVPRTSAQRLYLKKKAISMCTSIARCSAT